MGPVDELSALCDQGTVTVSDDRQLGYAQFGASDGLPVVAFSGTPGSRWFGAFFHDVAREAGYSVLSLERPGYGRSDPVPERRLQNWPSTVREATEALGIDEFGIVAFSGGGPHALACGIEIPDSVTAISLASPACRPAEFENRQYRAVLWLARNAPWLLSPLCSAMAGLSRKGNPEQIAANYIGSAVSDTEVANRLTAGEIAYVDFLEAFRNGPRGTVAELRLLATPWEIDLEGIDVPVECWHSDTDDEVPLSAARSLCDDVPTAEFHTLNGYHHGEVLVRCRKQLLASTRSESRLTS
jgi:pimeloyl-ACP methyl ester carboxylesterase